MVYYATDPDLQSQYISLYNARGIDVVLLDGIVDEQFIQAVESYKEGTSFKRVDADASALTEGEGEKSEKLTALFSSMATESMKLTVKTEKLADENVPAVLNIPEENRRMENMMKLYGAAMPGMPVEATLVVNTGNPIIKRLEEDGYGENADSVAKQVFSLALLSQRPLSAAERKDFLSESYRLLEKL